MIMSLIILHFFNLKIKITTNKGIAKMNIIVPIFIKIIKIYPFSFFPKLADHLGLLRQIWH